jgi:small GTP-binding protein
MALEMPTIQSPLNDDGIIYIKIVVFGQSGVGKTSFVRSAAGLAITHSPIPTKEIECTQLRWRVDNTEIRLMLWDTPGDGEYYETLNSDSRDILTKAVDGVVFVFDSFEKESIEYIFEKFANVSHQYGDEFKHLLVGSKKKLRKNAKADATVSLLGEKDIDYHFVDFHSKLAYQEVQRIMAPMLSAIIAKKSQQ